MRRPAHWILLAALTLVAGCRSAAPQGPGLGVEAVLPELPVYEIAPVADSVAVVRVPAASRDPLAGASMRRVTVTTDNADVRTLLLWLAQQAEVSLVISPDVRGRVSVAFRDVPAGDALRSVMAEAGLSVLVGGMEAPWPPVVFYQLPVNVNTASAEAIAARFGVSLDMAKFIVESRPRP